MAYFFSDFIRQQIALNQAVLDTRQFRLVFFQSAPSLSTINPTWTSARTKTELLATPGWSETSTSVTGYPLDYTVIIGTYTQGSSRYVMYDRYPFAELGMSTGIAAIGVVLIGSLGGQTEPLIFVTNTPLPGNPANIRPGDALTSNPDAAFPSAANRWLFGWGVVTVAGTVATSADLLTLGTAPVVNAVYLTTNDNHWWVYNGPDPNDNISKWRDTGVAAVVGVEGPLVISLGSPDFETSGSQHAWLYPQRVNMIANPSFEAAGTNYWASSGTLARVSGGAPGGGYFAGKMSDTTPSYVRLNGGAGCYIEGPDIAAFGGAKRVVIELDCSMDLWTATATLVGQTVTPLISWKLHAAGTGKIYFNASPDGTAIPQYISGTHGFVAGSRHTVGGLWLNTNGTNSTMQFVNDGVNYGAATVGVILPNGLYNSTRTIQIGRESNDTGRMTGNIYGLKVWADDQLVASPSFVGMAPGQTSVTDSMGNVWTLKGAAAVAGDTATGTVIAESNTFSTLVGEMHHEQWTIQLMAKGTGILKVGLVYWDAEYRATAAAWGETTEQWTLSQDAWTHVAVHRHAPQAHLAMVRLELRGTDLTMDKVLAEPGYLKDWLYFDGDETYGARDDFSWYGGSQRRGASYSFWYNHRRAVTGRLFARSVDPNDPTANVTDEDMEGQGLVYRWVPAGITVIPHLDVLYPFDTKSPVASKSGILPYYNSTSAPDGVPDPWV